MADSTTPNFGWSIPTNGGDAGTWGVTLNATLTSIDAQVALSLLALDGEATDLQIETVTPTATSAGYLGSPVNDQNGNYTFVATDGGKTVFHNSPTAHTYTIDTVALAAFPIGTAIGLVNYTQGANLIIQPATGVILIFAGTSSYGPRTIASAGLASLLMVGPDVWYIVGAGVS